MPVEMHAAVLTVPRKVQVRCISHANQQKRLAPGEIMLTPNGVKY